MTKLTRIETATYIITLVGEDYSNRRAPKPVRVYAPYTAPDMEEPAFTPLGEDKANDSAWRKYNKEAVRLMGLELTAVAEELYHTEGGLADTHLAALKALNMDRRFSRKAGCSCPCSPGFVAANRVHLAGHGYLQHVLVARKPVVVAPERTFTFADFDMV